MAVSKVILNGVTQMDVTADTVTADKLGSGYTATKNDGTKITGTAPISSTLDEMSWSTIKEISDAGLASTYFNVGDCKKIDIGENQYYSIGSNWVGFPIYYLPITGCYYAVIIGIDHNSSIEGTGITFQIGRLINESPYNYDTCLTEIKTTSYVSALNNYGTYLANIFMVQGADATGWANSYMRKTLLGISTSPYNSSTNPNGYKNSSLMAVLPPDLRAVMKSVTKWTDNTGGSTLSASNVTATTEYLFLPSAYEIFGSTTGFGSYNPNAAEANKQEQYEYYLTHDTYKWYFSASNTNQGGYSKIGTYLRSPVNYVNGNVGQYWAVISNIDSNPKGYHQGWIYSTWNNNIGISPCFVV